MNTLFVTKIYARPEMGRALLNAGQFAHVPALRMIKWFYDINPKPYVDIKQSSFIYYNAEEEFGVLCPVCLTKVGTDKKRLERTNYWVAQEYIPSWLVLNSRYGDTLNILVHTECFQFIRIFSELRMATIGNYRRLANISKFFTGQRGFRAYLKWLDEKEKHRLRFNPRKHVGYQPFHFENLLSYKRRERQ